MLALSYVTELLFNRGIVYDIQQSNLWLYRDGILLRTFIIRNDKINAADFRNWLVYMGLD